MKDRLFNVKDVVEQMELSAKENKVFVYDRYFITYEWTIQEYLEKGGNLKDYLDTYYTLKKEVEYENN